MPEELRRKIALTPENIATVSVTYADDPRGFLEDMLGFTQFDPWQLQVLEWLRQGETRIAIASCNGSGKTFLTSAIEDWWLVCKPDATVSVCSATYSQLMETHMREVRSHAKKSCIRDFYDMCNETRIRLPGSGDDAFISAVTNNKGRPEAIQGRHHGSLLTVFDEASGIYNEIFMAQEGNMSTAGATWIVIGNPISSGTAFHEIFRSRDDRWKRMHIDARQCVYTDKKWVDGMIEQYGIDDDRVRARILGQFPVGSVNTVVGEGDYDQAERNDFEQEKGVQVVIGLDVSSSKGKDATVICARADNKLLDIREIVHKDNIDLAEQAEKYFRDWKAAVICIDYTGGWGAGPGHILARMLPPGAVREVQFAGKSSDPTRWKNVRAEIWAKLGAWMKKADIPKQPRLRKDCVTIEWWINKAGQMQVEDKGDYQSRTGNGSPDWADSVACSLYADPMKRTVVSGEQRLARARQVARNSTWM